MSVSVVVICRNEAEYIGDCLTSVAAGASTVDMPVEVIVVDGGSTDDTVVRVRVWAAANPLGRRTRVVHAARPGYAIQRNLGVAAATEPWVLFVSADVRLPRQWARDVVDSIGPDVDLAVGRCDLRPPPGRADWLAALTPSVYPTVSANPLIERCSTVYLLVRRDALLGNPLDESMVACEDKELAYLVCNSSRWRGAAALSARATHLARESVPVQVRKVYRESRALAQVRHRYGAGFPDCFGWSRHARRSMVTLGGGLALASVAALPLPAICATASVLAAAVLFAVAGWHPVGWRRRGRTLSALPLAILHVATMYAVIAGQVTGLAAAWRAGRTGRRAETDTFHQLHA